MFESENLDQSKKLSSLAQDAAHVEGASGFMKPGEKQKGKNKGGRPPLSAEEKARREQERHFKKQGAQDQGPGPQTSQNQSFNIPSSMIAKPFCQGISGLAVAWADDPRASATPDEIEAMAQAMGMLLDKYMPTLASQYGAEMAFVLIFGQYGLRVMALKKLTKIEKEENEKKRSARADIVEETKAQVFTDVSEKTKQDNPLVNHKHDFTM